MRNIVVLSFLLLVFAASGSLGKAATEPACMWEDGSTLPALAFSFLLLLVAVFFILRGLWLAFR